MLKRTFALVTLLMLIGLTAQAVTVQVIGPSQTQAGDTPDICVFLPDNDGNVSGAQMDLSWDSSCLSAESGGGDEAACAVNPSTNRTTFRTKLQSPTQMRVIMLSINDTTPIPAGVQQLFCCQFRVSPAAGGRTCSVNLSNVIASNATGTRLPVTPKGGAVTVSGRSDSQGSGGGGGGIGGGMNPGVITGGQVPAPAPAGGGGQGSGTTSGSAPAAPAAPKGIAPGMPPVPQIPGMPEAPAAIERAEEAVQDAQETVSAVVGTIKPGTPAKTPGAGTPTVKTTAKETPQETPKETPKAAGTPSPEAKPTGKAGTPTAKGK